MGSDISFFRSIEADGWAQRPRSVESALRGVASPRRSDYESSSRRHDSHEARPESPAVEDSIYPSESASRRHRRGSEYRSQYFTTAPGPLPIPRVPTAPPPRSATEPSARTPSMGPYVQGSADRYYEPPVVPMPPGFPPRTEPPVIIVPPPAQVRVCQGC